MKSTHLNRIASLVDVSNHCTDSQLHRLLEYRATDKIAPESAAHVDTCSECQARLESIAEDGVSLTELRSFLGRRKDGPSDALAGEGQPGEVSGVSGALDVNFLSPSNRASSLGRFGRYEVEEIIGTGGMGVVLKGFDEALSRYSAIKVLAPVLATSAAARQRFSREAKSSAAVVHDHVVPIHTVDEEGGLPYFIMPLIEGESLEQRVASTGPLDVKEILRIGKQVAAGLAAAHEQGLVHRDVKPGNILLESGVERVLITDFGLARAIDDASVTQSGVIAGTPQYMSPEQARGESLDHRSDLFSLGSVLYFMCAGHSPFRAETTMGVLRRISDQTPRALCDVNSDAPDWLETIVMKLLAKNPDERFHSASEVSELLGKWLAHLQQPATVAPPSNIVGIKCRQADQPTRRSTGVGCTIKPRLSCRRRITAWLVTLTAAAALIAGVVIFVKLGETTIRFEIDDPAIAVHLSDQTITVDNDGEAIRIDPGDENTFTVTKNDEVIEGRSFKLNKGQKIVLSVTVDPQDNVKLRTSPQIPLARVAARTAHSETPRAHTTRPVENTVPANRTGEKSDAVAGPATNSGTG